MRAMRFRPCIDLHNSIVKQIVGGTLADGKEPTTNFTSSLSAKEYAEKYKKDNLPGGHVIMLGPGNDEAALSALQAYPGGLQIGGGINPSNAKQWLDAGASHVIVTSYIFENGSLSMEKLKELFAVTGKDKLVLDLSCRRKEDGKYYVVTDRWQTFTNLEVNKETIDMLSEYCAEFLVHGVDVEGKRMGIEEELVRLLGEHCSIPCTYAGGADLLSDLDRVKAMGKGKVDLTIGSSLDIFGGPISYDAVVHWQRQQEARASGEAKGMFGGFGRTYS
ncbi:hypothetical protein GUITHDRAFT_85755 [Guillardia theta CCMP2712]|uniref:1-(5-phosphoribosyl)-5-[(5-phosphoribosylamino)methylideneamino]imidazole-4-carboxamideisomerase n=1 Tax=Guillardia theta (strain CCMP2712) TaxID=905079 RepID=L1JLH4_GUITC|nr:hypothetical protein GUITHDRAFT_85755 [Guillardia theta CCMP2712]EKX49376.1 hypothetical protein GUITHDRAFT_85755 [Guillardia theta CCMP2712]|eukprot:XP_005836356.1 hypothetical protein GUITHDRAFT_85755 [Guillardia theta CCMP2712]